MTYTSFMVDGQTYFIPSGSGLRVPPNATNVITGQQAPPPGAQPFGGGASASSMDPGIAPTATPAASTYAPDPTRAPRIQETMAPDPMAAMATPASTPSVQTPPPSPATVQPVAAPAPQNPGAWSPGMSGDMAMDPRAPQGVPSPNFSDAERKRAGARKIQLAIEAGLFGDLDTGKGVPDEPDVFGNKGRDSRMRELAPEDIAAGMGSGEDYDIGIGGGEGGYNPFEGTWAENEGENVALQILNGEMSPAYATHRALAAQGLGGHAYQGALADQYALMPAYYKMMNPGKNALTPFGEYGEGGDYINALMDPSDGYSLYDPSQMWDNQFDPANDQVYGAAAKTSKTPASDQYSMISQNIEALAPMVGADNARALQNQTDQLFFQYQDAVNSGSIGPDVSFAQFMRANGAGDWF